MCAAVFEPASQPCASFTLRWAKTSLVPARLWAGDWEPCEEHERREVPLFNDGKGSTCFPERHASKSEVSVAARGAAGLGSGTPAASVPHEAHPAPLSSPLRTMSSNKTFRVKRILAKAQVQNRPIPQWCRLKTDAKITYNAKRRHWRRTKLNL
ncbi:hypothetical protein PCASD_17302 [Puccinia coronata f. sp. avenae]|uniref:Large ribosomal subunit protein eL39 n=1 Tax=Puccinia coronata f. sp. avenae TaxID=200324 RepID=A0A2N5T7G2_9BASI|nr:hypothetical protein PCASD_17302 [Puccinia coronata f. sp. avenae]